MSLAFIEFGWKIPDSQKIAAYHELAYVKIRCTVFMNVNSFQEIVSTKGLGDPSANLCSVLNTMAFQKTLI